MAVWKIGKHRISISSKLSLHRPLPKKYWALIMPKKWQSKITYFIANYAHKTFQKITTKNVKNEPKHKNFMHLCMRKKKNSK